MARLPRNRVHLTTFQPLAASSIMHAGMGGVDSPDDIEPRLAPGTAGLPLEAPYSRENFDDMMRRAPSSHTHRPFSQPPNVFPGLLYDHDFVPNEDNTANPDTQGFSQWIHLEFLGALRDLLHDQEACNRMRLTEALTEDKLGSLSLGELRRLLKAAGYQSPLFSMTAD